MPVTLTYHGHSALALELNGTNVLIDPFIKDNPMSSVDIERLKADYILVSHGHEDHVGDTVAIAQRTEATVVANFEIANWLSAQGLDKVHPQHIGGVYTHSFGYVKLTQAHHGSALPDGSYGGSACGFLIRSLDASIYLACDTGAFWRHEAHRRRRGGYSCLTNRRQLHHGSARCVTRYTDDKAYACYSCPLQHLASYRTKPN